MNSPDDTIAAISTPRGEGGIGIVRLSGRDAVSIADKVFSSPKGKRLRDRGTHTVTYGFIVDPARAARIDEVLVTVMRAPRTYTMEDVVEINCHGGMLPLSATLKILLREGARLAEPGEFTKRAFLNGRMDLSQAEAVIDIIKARTDQAERLALQQLEGRLSGRITGLRDRITDICVHIEACIDFPDDEPELTVKDEIITSMNEIQTELLTLSKGYDEGRFFREGVSAAIVGKPNVGKSSLLNALLEKDRAIVTDMPGTTRDVIEDYLNINGLPLRIMDTAGIRDTHNLAEMEGVKRSLKAMEGADIIIAVVDASRPIDEADCELLDKVKHKRTILLVNKCDRESSDFRLPDCSIDSVRASALKGEGIDGLKDKIYTLCISSANAHDTEDLLITNMRHKQSIDSASAALEEAGEAFKRGVPLEVTAISLRESLDALGTIVGMVTTEDILNRIFSEFCIGK
ncbi:MAG: tRNA uridine-5-carboxymethylaminomethyl(34) synthesis GTPase MnmE [Nitrospirae bacterium]|nr:tRNA uridine-5-carboxymethylaminomethyl(34) synthesis GTPase MnmE [Nitrospirota bacterium]